MNAQLKSRLTPTILFISLLLSFINFVSAHDLHYTDLPEKEWKLNTGETVYGHFYLLKSDVLMLEKNDGSHLSVPVDRLSIADKNWVFNKEESIKQINLQLSKFNPGKDPSPFLSSTNTIYQKWLIFSILMLLLVLIVKPFRIERWVVRWIVPVFSSLVLLLTGFTLQKYKKTSFDTRVSFMDSAFSYFKPDIHTRSDAAWYYVESIGLPDHETMLGITSWQQQVPIPQCYIGNNAWSIPLHPQIASTPVPVNTKHFLRGAIAIAVNGIAIFSPYTNTGVDAYVDGQLDQFGGHSGRADDYHYHIAPTVLYNKVPKNSPLAFALDGFAIYGNTEPEGTTQLPLDSNHGHYGKDGMYHYHISSAAPYMIKNMVGKVTEDSTMQIIPQATAKGCRPALTPLKGASITHNIPYPNKNGFVLTYTLNGNQDTIDYSWTPQGNYTYVFKTPTSKTTSNYKGNAICTVPQNSISSFILPDFTVHASSDKQLILHANNQIKSHCSGWRIMSADGKIMGIGTRWESSIRADFLTSGTYWLILKTPSQSYSAKFIFLP